MHTVGESRPRFPERPVGSLEMVVSESQEVEFRVVYIPALTLSSSALSGYSFNCLLTPPMGDGW